jgi:rhamnulokinase
MRYYIAVDLGASSGRVAVGSASGEFVETHRFPTRSETVNGSVYWDILSIFSEMKKGLKKAFSLYPDTAVSVSIDTWGVDFALTDAGGSLIAMPSHYRDGRTDGMMDYCFSRVPKETVYAETGIQFMQINTLYQLTAMKVRQGPLLEAAEHYLSIPDLLNFWLCGVMKNEFTHATTTQLYNPVTGDWSWKLIDSLGFKRSLFGEIVPSGTILGPLRPEVAAELKAPSDVLVIAGGSHDTASAVAAVPAEGTDPVLYISSGTWSLLGTVTKAPIITPASLAGNFTNEGAASGGFRFLKNIMGMWIQQETIRFWEEEGERVCFDELDRETLVCADFPAAVDPDDPRFLKPNSVSSPMPQRIAGWCREHGQAVPGRRGEYMAAVYRGLAEAYSRYRRQLEQITGCSYRTIHIIGGGCRNRILNQWTADAAGIPVSAGPVEATVIGNLFIQAWALGDVPDIAAARAQAAGFTAVQQFLPGREVW